jgi:hypothetical protein
MDAVVCDKCGEELLHASDSGEKIVNFRVECICGHTTTKAFLGYPKLAGNEKYYFEFVDEDKVICRLRRKT